VNLPLDQPLATANSAGPVIALVAGETSGDQLGGSLIGELAKLYPAARFVGIGGPHMKAQGLDAWWDSDELAVMGLAEVLSHLPRLLQLRKALQNRLLELKPDVFIGIDAPDFNLGLEKKLKKAGITTAHYVSPSIWAWRQNRAKTIGKCTDLVLCLFPFEPALYHAHGVAAQFIGHPMADEIDSVNLLSEQSEKHTARSELGLNPSGPCIAILPGSRQSEVERLGSHLLGAAHNLSVHDPATQFVAPMANKKVRTIFQAALDHRPGLDCTLVDGQARLTMKAADLVLCASGTAALEVLLINRPMVVVYRLSTVTYEIVKNLHLFKSKFFSLPNVLAGEFLVPELVQHQANEERITREALAWFDDDKRRESVRSRFSELHFCLKKNAAACAAASIKGLLEDKQ